MGSDTPNELVHHVAIVRPDGEEWMRCPAMPTSVTGLVLCLLPERVTAYGEDDDERWSITHEATGSDVLNRRLTVRAALRALPYSSLSVDQIAAMSVAGLAAPDAHLYLWTTNRYLRAAFDVAESWGFRPSQTLVWCKPPMGIGPGGAFSITTEFIVFARRGSLAHQKRIDSTWWEWSRAQHSAKPDAFMDLVEQVSPGPYVELFCRRPRLGWDSWGKGYEGHAA